MRSFLYLRVRRLVESDAGLILALFWGVSEALFWPILPDFFLVAATPTGPKRWWRLALFAVVGSIIGGSIGYWLAYPRQSSFPLEYLPLITEGMIDRAGSWLAELGPLGIIRQPLSGIPYKVFVYLSGAGRLSFGVFLWISVVARSLRLFVVAGLAAALGKIVPERKWSKWYDVFVAAFTVAFALGLRSVVNSFS